MIRGIIVSYFVLSTEVLFHTFYFFIKSTLTYSVDNINNQGVQDLFSDILFEASSLSRCDAIPIVTESTMKEGMLDTEDLNEGLIVRHIITYL